MKDTIEEAKDTLKNKSDQLSKDIISDPNRDVYKKVERMTEGVAEPPHYSVEQLKHKYEDDIEHSNEQFDKDLKVGTFKAEPLPSEESEFTEIPLQHVEPAKPTPAEQTKNETNEVGEDPENQEGFTKKVENIGESIKEGASSAYEYVASTVAEDYNAVKDTITSAIYGGQNKKD